VVQDKADNVIVCCVLSHNISSWNNETVLLSTSGNIKLMPHCYQQNTYLCCV